MRLLVSLLLLVPLPAFARDCEVADVIPTIRPGAEWNLAGDTLTWLDKKSTKPTSGEIAAAVAACRATTDPKVAAKQILKSTGTYTADQKLNALITYLGI